MFCIANAILSNLFIPLIHLSPFSPCYDLSHLLSHLYYIDFNHSILLRLLWFLMCRFSIGNALLLNLSTGNTAWVAKIPATDCRIRRSLDSCSYSSFFFFCVSVLHRKRNTFKHSHSSHPPVTPLTFSQSFSPGYHLLYYSVESNHSIPIRVLFFYVHVLQCKRTT